MDIREIDKKIDLINNRITKFTAYYIVIAVCFILLGSHFYYNYALKNEVPKEYEKFQKLYIAVSEFIDENGGAQELAEDGIQVENLPNNFECKYYHNNRYTFNLSDDPGGQINVELYDSKIEIYPKYTSMEDFIIKNDSEIKIVGAIYTAFALMFIYLGVLFITIIQVGDLTLEKKALKEEQKE